MPPRLAATFQKVHLSAYTSNNDFTGLTSNQAAPKAYVDHAIATATASATTEAAIDTKIAAERVIRVAAEAQVLADAHTAALGLIDEERPLRVAAEALVLSTAKEYAELKITNAINTIISGGPDTLRALDTINNIYTAITGESTGIVSGLLFTKASLATPNTFTAPNTFASGLTISGTEQQFLYFGPNWRVCGTGPELKFQYASVAGDFTTPQEIVFAVDDTPAPIPVEVGITSFSSEWVDGSWKLTPVYVGTDSADIWLDSTIAFPKVASGVVIDVPNPDSTQVYTLRVQSVESSVTLFTYAQILSTPAVMYGEQPDTYKINFTFKNTSGLASITSEDPDFVGPEPFASGVETLLTAIKPTLCKFMVVSTVPNAEAGVVASHDFWIAEPALQAAGVLGTSVIDNKFVQNEGQSIKFWPIKFHPTVANGATVTLSAPNGFLVENIVPGQQIDLNVTEETVFTFTISYPGSPSAVGQWTIAPYSPPVPVAIPLAIQGFDYTISDGMVNFTASFTPTENEGSSASIEPGGLSISTGGSTSTTAPGVETLYTLTVTNGTCDPPVVSRNLTVSPLI